MSTRVQLFARKEQEGARKLEQENVTKLS